MFPANDADFDLVVGEQFGGTLGEIPAAFGLRPEAVLLPRRCPGAAEDGRYAPRSGVPGQRARGPLKRRAPPSGESGARRRSRSSAGDPWPADWVSR